MRRNRPIWPGYATVPDAVRYLASACDGARRRDGHGFGADDVAIGHWLAGCPEGEWDADRYAAGRRLVTIYRHQLAQAGFDPTAILRGRRPPRIRQRHVDQLRTGWAADPAGLWAYRWWNGVRWTEHVSRDNAWVQQLPDQQTRVGRTTMPGGR